MLPGGLVERGERARAACARKVREEVGLTVRPVSFVGLFDALRRGPRGNGSAAYLCVPRGDAERTAREEAQRADTVDPESPPSEAVVSAGPTQRRRWRTSTRAPYPRTRGPTRGGSRRRRSPRSGVRTYHTAGPAPCRVGWQSCPRRPDGRQAGRVRERGESDCHERKRTVVVSRWPWRHPSWRRHGPGACRCASAARAPRRTRRRAVQSPRRARSCTTRWIRGRPRRATDRRRRRGPRRSARSRG